MVTEMVLIRRRCAWALFAVDIKCTLVHEGYGWARVRYVQDGTEHPCPGLASSAVFLVVVVRFAVFGHSVRLAWS